MLNVVNPQQSCFLCPSLAIATSGHSVSWTGRAAPAARIGQFASQSPSKMFKLGWTCACMDASKSMLPQSHCTFDFDMANVPFPNSISLSASEECLLRLVLVPAVSAPTGFSSRVACHHLQPQMLHQELASPIHPLSLVTSSTLLFITSSVSVLNSPLQRTQHVLLVSSGLVMALKQESLFASQGWLQR